MEQEPGSSAGSVGAVISDGTIKGYHLRLFHFRLQDPVILGTRVTYKLSGAEVGEHGEHAAVILRYRCEVQLREDAPDVGFHSLPGEEQLV